MALRRGGDLNRFRRRARTAYLSRTTADRVDRVSTALCGRIRLGRLDETRRRGLPADSGFTAETHGYFLRYVRRRRGHRILRRALWIAATDQRAEQLLFMGNGRVQRQFDVGHRRITGGFAARDFPARRLVDDVPRPA